MPEDIKRANRDRRAHKSKVVTGQKPKPQKRPSVVERLDSLEAKLDVLEARIETLESA